MGAEGGESVGEGGELWEVVLEGVGGGGWSEIDNW